MQEVIARRKGGLLLLYGFCFLVGIGVVVSGLYQAKKPDGQAGEIIILGGIILIVSSLIICISWLKTPKIVVVYDGERILLPKRSCLPSEITNVNYKCASARGVHYRWGKLIIFVNGQPYTYRFVADVEEAHDRLIALRLQNERKENEK